MGADERGNTMFTVIENTPGYLPDSEPDTFDTFDDAKAYADELIESLVDDGFNWDSDLLEPGTYYGAWLSDPSKTHDLGRVIEVLYHC